MSATSLDSANKIINWIESNNGFWNHQKLEVKESKLGGIGVFAKEDLESINPLKPIILLRLHKESLLSFQKANIANLLTDEGINDALALVISFIYEKDQNESSPWYPFIESIKFENNGQLILPPSSWTKEQKLVLKGTELDLMGVLDDEENSIAFERACEFAISQYQASCKSIKIPYELDVEDVSAEEFLKKYHTFIAISHAVAARDFEIDEFHQVAMVPGACLFNHSDKPSVRFESLFDVCGACGIADGCDHFIEYSDEEEEKEEEEEEEEEEEGCKDSCLDNFCGDGEEKKEGESCNEEDHLGSESEEEFDGSIEEFIEIIEVAYQREKEEKAKFKVKEPQAIEQNPEDIIQNDEGKIISPDDCVDIVVTRSVKKGEELFNTYGDFNNSILLFKYGFIIPGNQHNTVSLGVQFLKFKKSNKKTYSTQFEWWENEGFEAMRQYLSSKKNICEDEDCEDKCCGGGEEEEEGEEEEIDVDDVTKWSMEMLLNSEGEPTPITYALLKLLSLNKMEVSKLLKNPNRVNLQVLTTKSSKALKILKELVEARLKQYGDLKLNKLINSGDERVKMGALLAKDEQDILRNALKFIEKNIH